MTLSRRDRRDLRVFLLVSLASMIASAFFTLRVALPDQSWRRAVVLGIATSLAIATPILIFELRSARPGLLNRLRRLPLAAYFAIKLLFYVVVILGGLVLVRVLLTNDDFALDSTFRKSVVFAVVMSIAGNLLFEMGGLLGFGTLKNLLTGRYVQPRHEQRAFLLIDMKDSTGLAERLGPVRFHELLNDFFRDVAYAALECEAEIHKYVGDEAILTWPPDAAFADGECLICPFLARDTIERNKATYLARYGVVPTFRAAVHRGDIVAGEIGDVRREIAYVGDTLNVSARLLDAAKQLGRDVLVSTDLLERAALPPGLKAEKLPTLAVRGRSAPLGVAALERTTISKP
jgi:adenylate cyclase